MGSGDDRRWVVSSSHGFPTQPIPPCTTLLWGSNLCAQLRCCWGGGGGGMALAVLGSWLDSFISKVFSSPEWLSDSLAAPAQGVLWQHQALISNLSSVWEGSSPRAAAGGGFWDWHPVRTGWITVTDRSCRGAQQGDKCSAKHREAKTEDVEEKRTFTFFTWRSKINMGTFPRRGACCGIDTGCSCCCEEFAETRQSSLLLGQPRLSWPKLAKS